jgi:hypothetical protein
MIPVPDSLKAPLAEIVHTHMLATASVEGDLAALDARIAAWLEPFRSTGSAASWV